MKSIGSLVAFLVVLVLLACTNETSIQKYYVENQENSKFVAIDIPTSLLANQESLNEEQLATLETVKKVSLLAFPVEEGREKYEKEKLHLQEILKNEKYQLLMKYGSGERKAEIYFSGDEEAVDEFIVFGFDDGRGMGLARVLGNDMNPEKLINFLSSVEKGNIDLSGLHGLAEMFIENNSKRREIAGQTTDNPEKAGD